MVNQKENVLVYLHIEDLQENDPLPATLGKDFYDKRIEDVSREILERAVESSSQYKLTAENLLEQMDNPEESRWKDNSFYKVKDPATRRLVPVSRDSPLKKYISIERTGAEEIQTSHLFLKANIQGGYQPYRLSS